MNWFQKRMNQTTRHGARAWFGPARPIWGVKNYFLNCRKIEIFRLTKEFEASLEGLLLA